jgi:hypothetical protein
MQKCVSISFHPVAPDINKQIKHHYFIVKKQQINAYATCFYNTNWASLRCKLLHSMQKCQLEKPAPNLGVFPVTLKKVLQVIIPRYILYVVEWATHRHGNKKETLFYSATFQGILLHQLNRDLYTMTFYCMLKCNRLIRRNHKQQRCHWSLVSGYSVCWLYLQYPQVKLHNRIKFYT